MKKFNISEIEDSIQSEIDLLNIVIKNHLIILMMMK